MKVNCLFQVLGALEVLRDGEYVTPTAPKVRQVLALLALQANSTVRIGQFVEELWGDNSPASAATTLQTYIYQLRKLLITGAGDGGAPLLTRPGGYVLTVPPDAIDLGRVEDLVARGRSAFADNDVEKASVLFREALSSWRGPALSDVTCGPILHAAAVRLDEYRTNVLDQRLEADLMLGRHAELISELREHTAHRPTDERLHGKLMIALHRSGRRVEALHDYQQLRRALVDDIGIEPSAALQQLHQSLLTAAPELDVPQVRSRAVLEVAQPAEPVIAPDPLPPDVAVLQGRHDVERAVRRWVTDPGRSDAVATVVVTGPPGAGKSALCLHLAHTLEPHFRHSVFHATHGGPLTPDEVLHQLLLAAGVRPADVPAGRERCRQLLSTLLGDRRMLIVLDDVLGMAELTGLLTVGPGSVVLASSRRRLAGRGIRSTIQLDRLSDADSLQVLRRRDAGQSEADPQAAGELVRLCEGLPLLLTASADLLALRPHWSIGQLTKRLQYGRLRLMDLAADGRSFLDSLDSTYTLLPERCRSVALTLAMECCGTASPQQVELLAHLQQYEAEPLLEELVEFHLVRAQPAAGSDGDFRYQMSPLVADGLVELAVRHDHLKMTGKPIRSVS